MSPIRYRYSCPCSVSVCLSDTFARFAQTTKISTRFILHTTVPRPSHIDLKFGFWTFGLWTFGTFSICILVYILLIAYCSIQPLVAILNKPIIILNRSKFFLPKFCPKVMHPLLIWASETFRWQIAAKWLETAQWSQWRAYRKPPSLFRMVPSLTLYDLPFSVY